MSDVRAVTHTLDTAVRQEASYLEIEISRGFINFFERQGDGKTAELIQALARYGLHLAERVSSPCG